VDLADVPSSYTGQAGRVPAVNSGETALEFVERAYDFGFSFPGGPPTSSEVLGKVVIPRDLTLPADFAGAAGHIDTNPTAQFDIDVTDDGTSIGTISISTGGVFTFATDGNTAKSVAAGSVLRFVAAASTDATAANISATLQGALD
jgi:VCBS repeat-containing protein